MDLKPIRLSAHARGYITRRGFSETEVKSAIVDGDWQQANDGRLEASLEFPFNSLWNGKFYTTKRVRPVFVETATEILVVTVYTYFY
jgi:hypothetical protein